MKVQTYINEGPGMFWGYEPGDKLVPGPIVNIRDVEQRDFETLLDHDLAIAETVWMIGNRMGVDIDRQPWPSTVRSLSVGDVIVIGQTAYTAASFGWDRIESDALAWSLDPERHNRNLRLEEARR